MRLRFSFETQNRIDHRNAVLECDLLQRVRDGSGEVLRNARNGTRIIELSTISPEFSRRLHQAAQKRGMAVLDLAVSGSTPAA